MTPLPLLDDASTPDTINHAVIAGLLDAMKARGLNGMEYSSGLEKDGAVSDAQRSIELFASFASGESSHYVHCSGGYITVSYRRSGKSSSTGKVCSIKFDLADPDVFDKVIEYIKESQNVSQTTSDRRGK